MGLIVKPFIAMKETPTITEDIQGEEVFISDDELASESPIAIKQRIMDDFVDSFSGTNRKTKKPFTRFPKSFQADPFSHITMSLMEVRRERGALPIIKRQRMLEVFGAVPKVRIVRRRWSDKDITLLRRIYSDKDVKVSEVSTMLGRSPTSIRKKASRLGVKRK